MCGLATEGMYAFPMHVWESFADADGACPGCTATIAAHDG